MTGKSNSDQEPTVRLPQIPVDLEYTDPERTLVREDHTATLVREVKPVQRKKG